MKLATTLFLTIPVLASTNELPAPRWGIQVGVIRSTGNNTSLNGQTGLNAELFWSRPFTARQDFQIRVGLTAVNGKTISYSAYDISNWPPIYVGELSVQAKINTPFVGLDYRVRWFRGATTPYFVIGALGGYTNYTETQMFNGISRKCTDRGFKGGGSWGFGCLFGKHFGLDLRSHGFNAQDSDGGYVLAASYRF